MFFDTIQDWIDAGKPLNSLICGDCMEGLKEIPDKYFDLALTDPPYNLGRKYNYYNDNRPDYKQWCLEWFNGLNRISKSIVMSVGVVNLPMWYEINPPQWLWCWFKANNMGSSSKITKIGIWEPFLIYNTKIKISVDGYYLPIVPQKDANFHNCPKPLKLIRRLLLDFGRRNDKIIDPFTGSGTTLIACEREGFQYIGFELDKDYFQAAKQRIIDNRKQLKLGI